MQVKEIKYAIGVGYDAQPIYVTHVIEDDDDEDIGDEGTNVAVKEESL